MKIVLGDICYPKSDSLIIPGNTIGSMLRGRQLRIAKDGLGGLVKEAKQVASDSKLKPGDCFTTGPGRLNRRGLKKIYHAVIKRLQSDYTSIYTIRESLQFALQKAIKDGMKSISICGIGIEAGEIDKKSVAIVTWDICSRYDDKIEIKIIDEDVDFIKEIVKMSEEY